MARFEIRGMVLQILRLICNREVTSVEILVFTDSGTNQISDALPWARNRARLQSRKAGNRAFTVHRLLDERSRKWLGQAKSVGTIGGRSE